MPKYDSYDKDAIEKYFVEQTSPSISFVDFAGMTGDLACTGRRKISHETLRAWAKHGDWLNKRAAYLAEQSSGVTDDMENIYKIVRHRLMEGGSEMAPGSLANLVKQFLAVVDELNKRRPDESLADEEADFVTGDEVKDIIRDVKPSITKDHLFGLLEGTIAEETPA